MTLLVDIGNTRIKWAFLSAQGLSSYGQCLHDESHVLEELLRNGPLRPGHIYVSCVAGNDTWLNVSQRLQKFCDRPVRRLQTGVACCGVSNGYIEPMQLGVDRWVALIAAYNRFEEPLCVVDCGSAVTVDALSGDGTHLGGYIVPGMTMQRKLLQEGTAAVSATAGRIPEQVWGRDTAGCLLRGSAEAIAGLVERSVRQLERECGEGIKTVVTGGDAAGILPILSGDAHHEEHLVLQGMALMIRELEG